MVWGKGGFRCMSCGETGTWKKLWDKLQGVTVRPRQDFERGRATPFIPNDIEGFSYQSHKALLSLDGRDKYLLDRGVGSMIEPALLGYHEGWYTVPVRDEDLSIVGVTLRAGPVAQQHTGLRFCNPIGQNAMLYVPDWKRWRAAEEVYIVYGIFDALAMASQGLPVATTVGGKQTMNPRWLDKVRKPIHIVPDEAEMGDARRLAAGLGWRGRLIRIDYPQDMKDPADIAAAGLQIGDYL